MPSLSGYFVWFVCASVMCGAIAAAVAAVATEEHIVAVVAAVVAAVVVLAGLVTFVLYQLAWIDYKRRLPS